jgi:hypothetical protein
MSILVPASRGCRPAARCALLVAGVFTLFAGAANAAVIAQWNFNGALTGTTIASAGSGTLMPVGVTSSGFGSGAVTGGSSDPVRGNPPNYGVQIWGFPAQGSADRTAGIQVSVDSRGWQSLGVSFDLRASSGSPRHQQFQYALDGRSFVDFGAPYVAGNGDQWVLQRTIDLDSIAGASDNAQLAFRLVAAFAPGGSTYLASGASAAYSTQGTWRFDMLTVTGEARSSGSPGSGVAVVPLPGAGVLLGAGLAALGAASTPVRRQRRRTPG